MISEQPQGAVLRLGKVVKVHPSDHSIDVVLTDNGAKMANVQLLAPTASTRAGRVDLPTPDLPDPANPWSMALSETHDLMAVVAMMGGVAVCLGFLYPQVNQLAMPEATQNFRIDRHASDFYQTIDDNGVMTFNHPGGSYISMGGGFVDLTGQDFDRKWALDRNQNSITTTIYNPTGPGAEKPSEGMISCSHTEVAMKAVGKGGATLSLTLTGFITAHASDSISADADKDISANADEDISATAGQNISVTAGAHIGLQAPLIDLN